MRSLCDCANNCVLYDGVEAMSNFPDFDFKIDCGDDPRVRQWLHDNGFNGYVLDSCQKYIYVHPKGNYLGNHLGWWADKIAFLEGRGGNCAVHVNPFDYMDAPEPTIPERMAARDDREPTLKEKYVMWKVEQAEIKPIPRELTIPSICLADPVVTHMMGGHFGSMNNDR